MERIAGSAQDATPAVHREPLFASAAKVDITPPVGMPLQGYGARMGEPSRGIRDPLHARVLVLRTHTSRLVIVSCDLMGVTGNLYEAILARVRRSQPLDRREFILLATHTHSGAGGLSDRFVMQFVGGRFRPKLFRDTTDRIAAAILDALQRTQPAMLSFARGDVEGVNRNRAKRDAPVDRELATLRVTTDGSEPLAWLVNFAAHPTVFGANWEFTADYPGHLAGKLEEDGSVALFANGDAGNLNIQGQGVKDRAKKAERAGHKLAARSIELVDGAPFLGEVRFTARQVPVEFPPVRVRVGKNPHCALPACWGNTLFPRRATFHVARIEDQLLLAVPFELSTEVGLALKESASKLGCELFILGYANDYLGYVLPERFYETDEYEARTSFYGPKLDSYLLDVSTQMMESLAR